MKKITLENNEVIELTEEDYEGLLKKSKKIDFNKFIGRLCNILCIKGENIMLKSFESGLLNLRVDNINRDDYVEPINYEVIEMKDLRIGDIFILDDIEHFKLDNFEIFLGKDYSDDFTTQHIIKYEGIEMINYKHYYNTSSTLVKRFLRE